MSKAIAIVGPSGAGKTELICSLLNWFGRRGLRVAVLKHTHHQDPDRGKDTWRFRRAGAGVVALAGPGLLQISRPYPAEPSLSEVLASLDPEADLILVEGYKSGPLPKIVVLSPAPAEALLADPPVIATVRQALPDRGEPGFQPEVAALGALILKHLNLGT